MQKWDFNLDRGSSGWCSTGTMIHVLTRSQVASITCPDLVTKKLHRLDKSIVTTTTRFAKSTWKLIAMSEERNVPMMIPRSEEHLTQTSATPQHPADPPRHDHQTQAPTFSHRHHQLNLRHPAACVQIPCEPGVVEVKDLENVKCQMLSPRPLLYIL